MRATIHDSWVERGIYVFLSLAYYWNSPISPLMRPQASKVRSISVSCPVSGISRHLITLQIFLAKSRHSYEMLRLASHPRKGLFQTGTRMSGHQIKHSIDFRSFRQVCPDNNKATTVDGVLFNPCQL